MWPHKAYNISFEDDDTADDCVASKPAYDYDLTTAPRYVYPDDDDDEEDDVFQHMIKRNKMPLLYDAFGKETTTTAVVITPVSNEQKTIYSLFDTYLSASFLDHFRLAYDEVYETVSARAKPHCNEVARDKQQIEAIIDGFISRMVLEMLDLDKTTTKAREIGEKIDALYYVRTDQQGKTSLVSRVKNDFVRRDEVDRMRLTREKSALDRTTDRVFMHFSEPKKRGRHSKNRVEEVWNEIETLASQYIIAKKSDSTEPVVTQQKAANIDLYPIFERELTIRNKAIPQLANHGWYLENLLRAIRALDPKVWPLHGLASMLHNANYVIHAKRVVTKFDRTQRRFYCCFSGLEIKSGETVTWIKVVENDAERLAAWQVNNGSAASAMRIDRPFESPEFKRSVASFYMKTELCCPISLFYAPFSQAYKTRFASHFTPKTISVDLKRKATTDSPSKAVPKRARQEVHHPLAQVMLHLVSIVRGDDDDDALWFHDELVKYRKNYASEKTEIISVFEAMREKTYTVDLQRVLYYCLLGSPYYDIESASPNTQLRHIADFLDAVLDFFELCSTVKHATSILAQRLTLSIEKRKNHRTEYSNLLGARISDKMSESQALSQFASLPVVSQFPLFFIALFEYLFAQDIGHCIRPTGHRLMAYRTLMTHLHLSRK